MAAATTTLKALDDTAYVSLTNATATRATVRWREGQSVRCVVQTAQPAVGATNWFPLDGFKPLDISGLTAGDQVWARAEIDKAKVAVVTN